MKIVVLDGHGANPGDLTWDALHALGACIVYDRTAPSEIAEHAVGAEIILTNKTPLTAETISALPNLRYIGVLATGYNVVDVAAARARGVVVTNVPAYGTHSVAQHAFALLLELTNSVGLHAADVDVGGWSSSIDWCYWKQPLVELDGLTLGLVGSGRIGALFGRICEVVGMKVQFVSSRSDRSQLLELLRTSDVVSLHCPLTPQTNRLINRETLALFKSTAYLLNTARGPLIDEADLAEALNAGRLAGAGLDVLSSEPPDASNPLLAAKNCVITPHVAWASSAARRRLIGVAVENVRAFIEGQPQNVVS